MTLSKRHQRFLLIEQCAMPSLVNLLVNGLIAWSIHRSAIEVQIWGGSSVAVDLLATAFLLPFLICVIVSMLVTRQVRSGKLPPLPPKQFPLWPWYQRPSALRGLILGTIGVLFAAVPVVWALSLGKAQPFSIASFVIFKAVWAAMLASIVTPIVGWWALASASPRLSLVNVDETTTTSSGRSF